MHFKHFVFVFLIFLFSCGGYDKRIIISVKNFGHSIDKKQQTIVFFQSFSAYKRPTGCLTFPDGGVSKILFLNNALYSYNYGTSKLVKINEFPDFPKHKSVFQIFTSIKDNRIVYSFEPTNGWDTNIHSFNAKLRKKYTGIFLYDLTDSFLIHISTNGIAPIISPNGKAILYLVKNNTNFSLVYKNLSSQKTEVINTKKWNPYWKLWIEKNIVFWPISNKTLDWYQINVINHSVVPLSKEENREKRKFFANNRDYAKQIIKTIPIQKFHYDMMKVTKKKKRTLIQEISKIDNNTDYRLFILAQFGDTLSAEDIRFFINDIKKQLNKNNTRFQNQRNQPILDKLNFYLKKKKHE